MNDPEKTRGDFLERCTACGLCAGMCPPFAHRSVHGTLQQVQDRVRAFLGGAPPDDAVIERGRLCNECWKCVTDTCPQGLDPLRTNQLLRGLLNEEGVEPRPFTPPSDAQSSERIAAALLTTEEEYRRITAPAVRGDGRILFFPGCNIYYQPDLLLTAMDVLDALVDGWTFLPGLELCCGSNHDSAGRLEAGADALAGLAEAMGNPAFEAVVTWCSTCALRLAHAGYEVPVTSLAGLLADRLDQLPEAGWRGGGVTLQEPCKDAYMGMDTAAPRAVLDALAKEPVREMERHGRGTVCCGWALYQHRPDAWAGEMSDRFAEARKTGAGTIATVCHGCQWIMTKHQAGSGIDVVNYVKLAGEALGIRHRERFRELRTMTGPDAAIDHLRSEMGGRFEALPFEPERIRRTVQILTEGFYGS